MKLALGVFVVGLCILATLGAWYQAERWRRTGEAAVELARGWRDAALTQAEAAAACLKALEEAVDQTPKAKKQSRREGL